MLQTRWSLKSVQQKQSVKSVKSFEAVMVQTDLSTFLCVCVCMCVCVCVCFHRGILAFFLSLSLSFLQRKKKTEPSHPIRVCPWGLQPTNIGWGRNASRPSKKKINGKVFPVGSQEETFQYDLKFSSSQFWANHSSVAVSASVKSALSSVLH